jgi:hypothetical protein
VAVTLNADAAVFSGSSSRTVTTGGDGTASAPLTAPPGFTATSVNVQATASASVGLELVSVVAGAGQQYAQALYADPPQTYTGQLTVQVDETAHPVLSLGAGGTGGTPGVAGVVGVAVPLSLTVTGMHGHSGQAQLEAVGPAPLDATRLCAGGVPTGDNAAAYTSPVLTVTGDQSVSANDWLPDKPGCYRLRAQLVTTDAVPQAKAVSPAVVVTVLDSTATFRATRTVIGSGPFAGTLAQAHTHGLSGTAQVQVRGPAAPRSGDCSAVDWSRVPAHVIARFPVQGDRSYQVISAPVTTPGCYRLAGVVGLAVPGGATAAVPLQISGDGAVFVLRPAVTVTADQPWSVSPAAVGAHVTVSGTYGQAGTLRIAMVRVPAGPMGCRGVDLSAATTVDTGPSVPFTGDGTYAVRSGRTPQNGCYGLVPTLRMDVNTAITATARPGLDAIVLAGLSPAIVAAGDNPPARPLEAPRALTVWPAAAIYLVLFLAVAAVTGKVANDARHVERRPAPGLDLLD